MKITPEIANNIRQLYQNGEYYSSIGEVEGALVSYSSCASIIHTVLTLNSDECNKDAAADACPDADDFDFYKGTAEQHINIKVVVQGKLETLLNQVISQVETLQGKLKQMKNKSSNDDDEEDDIDWKEKCMQVHPLVFKGGGDCIFYSDIAGLQKQKTMIKDTLIKPLIYPNLYPKIGKGFLLYGPPGTGKTLLAKASVNELQLADDSVKVLFFAPTGAELKGKYVGETEKRIKEAFVCASRKACECEKDSEKTGASKKYISVIFIDEVDSVAGDRSQDQTGLVANSVNTLLQMMDGIDSYDNVAVICATNYPWKLDSAVLRRLDTQVLLGLPETKQIVAQMEIEFNNFVKLSEKQIMACDKHRGIGSDDKDITPETEESSDDPCSTKCTKSGDNTSVTDKPPLDVFQFQFTQDSNKNYLKSIAKMMTEKGNRFSNSDVSKVMQRAQNFTATAAIKNNIFYNGNFFLLAQQSESHNKLKDYYFSTLNFPENAEMAYALQSNYYKDLSILLEGVSDEELIVQGKSYVHPPPIQRACYKDFFEGNPNGWSLLLNIAGGGVLYFIESTILSMSDSNIFRGSIFAIHVAFIMGLSWGFPYLLRKCKLTQGGKIMFNEIAAGNIAAINRFESSVHIGAKDANKYCKVLNVVFTFIKTVVKFAERADSEPLRFLVKHLFRHAHSDIETSPDSSAQAEAQAKAAKDAAAVAASAALGAASAARKAARVSSAAIVQAGEEEEEEEEKEEEEEEQELMDVAQIKLLIQNAPSTTVDATKEEIRNYFLDHQKTKIRDDVALFIRGLEPNNLGNLNKNQLKNLCKHLHLLFGITDGQCGSGGDSISALKSLVENDPSGSQTAVVHHGGDIITSEKLKTFLEDFYMDNIPENLYIDHYCQDSHYKRGYEGELTNEKIVGTQRFYNKDILLSTHPDIRMDDHNLIKDLYIRCNVKLAYKILQRQVKVLDAWGIHPEDLGKSGNNSNTMYSRDCDHTGLDEYFKTLNSLNISEKQRQIWAFQDLHLTRWAKSSISNNMKYGIFSIGAAIGIFASHTYGGNLRPVHLSEEYNSLYLGLAGAASGSAGLIFSELFEKIKSNNSLDEAYKYLHRKEVDIILKTDKQYKIKNKNQDSLDDLLDFTDISPIEIKSFQEKYLKLYNSQYYFITGIRNCYQYVYDEYKKSNDKLTTPRFETDKFEDGETDVTNWPESQPDIKDIIENTVLLSNEQIRKIHYWATFEVYKNTDDNLGDLKIREKVKIDPKNSIKEYIEQLQVLIQRKKASGAMFANEDLDKKIKKIDYIIFCLMLNKFHKSINKVEEEDKSGNKSRDILSNKNLAAFYLIYSSFKQSGEIQIIDLYNLLDRTNILNNARLSDVTDQKKIWTENEHYVSEGKYLQEYLNNGPAQKLFENIFKQTYKELDKMVKIELTGDEIRKLLTHEDTKINKIRFYKNVIESSEKIFNFNLGTIIKYSGATGRTLKHINIQYPKILNQTGAQHNSGFILAGGEEEDKSNFKLETLAKDWQSINSYTEQTESQHQYKELSLLEYQVIQFYKERIDKKQPEDLRTKQADIKLNLNERGRTTLVEDLKYMKSNLFSDILINTNFEIENFNLNDFNIQLKKILQRLFVKEIMFQKFYDTENTGQTDEDVKKLKESITTLKEIITTKNTYTRSTINLNDANFKEVFAVKSYTGNMLRGIFNKIKNLLGYAKSKDKKSFEKQIKILMGEQFSYLGYYSKYTTHYGIETITDQAIKKDGQFSMKPSEDGSKNIVWITFNSTASKRDDEMYEENLESLMGILDKIEIEDEANDKELNMLISIGKKILIYLRLSASAVFMLIKRIAKQFPKLMIQSAAIWALVSFLLSGVGIGGAVSMSLLNILGIIGAATLGPLLMKLIVNLLASFTGSFGAKAKRSYSEIWMDNYFGTISNFETPITIYYPLITEYTIKKSIDESISIFRSGFIGLSNIIEMDFDFATHNKHYVSNVELRKKLHIGTLTKRVNSLQQAENSDDIKELKKKIKQKIKVVDILPEQIVRAMGDQSSSYDETNGQLLIKYDQDRIATLEEIKKTQGR